MYVEMNAWREMLARTFKGFAEQDNVSPAWLINPATKRRLKLDKYYPEAGIAIRFIGLTAKGQGRQSDEDVLDTQQRDETRADLCRANGVQLVLVDPAEDPRKQLDQLLQALTRTSRLLAQGDASMQYKQKWMPALHEARSAANKLHSSLAKNSEQMMANWADSWRDRETGFAQDLHAAAPVPQLTKRITYVVGQRVHHERFGEGTITKLSEAGELSISFDANQERTFAAALVQDKLTTLG